MTNPVVARKIGITIFFQELNIVKDLDVASNIFLGQEPVRKKFFLNETEIYSQSAKLLEELELNSCSYGNGWFSDHRTTADDRDSQGICLS